MMLWQKALCQSLSYVRTSTALSSVRWLQNVSRETVSDADLLRTFTSPEGKPIIAGRPYLPGSDGQDMPRYLSGPRDDFPWVVDMTEVASTKKLSQNLVNSVKSILKQHLLQTGAVLFKGLPLSTVSDVATFTKHLNVTTMNYLGGTAVREALDGDVMTASREPPCFSIEPHNEMAYLKKFPTHLAFFCQVPTEAGHGGESVIVANRDFQGEIQPEVKTKFNRLGIRYNHFLPNKDDEVYLSWQEVLMTEDINAAKRILSDKGYSHDCKNDSVTYWHQLPATRPHHTTGEEIWFNQAQANHASYFRAHPFLGRQDTPDEKMPFHTLYGDGTPIEPEVIQHIRDVTWKHAVGLRLLEGEMLFLDNMLVQHGRLGYVGNRQLIVTLVQDMHF